MATDREVKLSPSSTPPSYHFLPGEDDYSGRYNHNPPMKHKNPSGTIYMSSADSSFPTSPHVCPEPFWGQFGVSATPVSVRSEPSPTINLSPQMDLAGGLNDASPHSRQQTPPQNNGLPYCQEKAPLLAPKPLSLRPATTQEGIPYRQNSEQTVSTPPSSATEAQSSSPKNRRSLAARRKMKSPSRNSQGKGIVFATDKSLEDQLVLDLYYVEQLSWKKISQKFYEKTGQLKSVPTLQMRKKRACDRLRVWTDDDVRHLNDQ